MTKVRTISKAKKKDYESFKNKYMINTGCEYIPLLNNFMQCKHMWIVAYNSLYSINMHNFCDFF